MNDQNPTYSLKFSNFAIEYDVKVAESLQWTHGFTSVPEDFVFVVAETWLRIAEKRYLLESATQPGNLIEELKLLAAELSNPPFVKDIENIIPLGGWTAWMNAFFGRIDDDTSTSEDEFLAEKLVPLLLMTSHTGQMAAYMYNGAPIIEVATRSGNDEPIVTAYSRIDCEKIVLDIESMRQQMKLKILALGSSSES